MKKTNSKPIFTIRRIANRNPRFPRIYRNARERIWRLAVVIFLAIVGAVGLFTMNNSTQTDKKDSEIYAENFPSSFLGLFKSEEEKTAESELEKAQAAIKKADAAYAAVIKSQDSAKNNQDFLKEAVEFMEGEDISAEIQEVEGFMEKMKAIVKNAFNFQDASHKSAELAKTTFEKENYDSVSSKMAVSRAEKAEEEAVKAAEVAAEVEQVAQSVSELVEKKIEEQNTEEENAAAVSARQEADAAEKADREQTKIFIGTGFEDITGFGRDGKNPTIENLDDEDFKKLGGVGIINSLFYNIKDYFKYIAGSMALLYVLISIMQIIVATGDEGIEKGRKNLKWSLLGLITVFAIDVIVMTFFEGGVGIPGESLFLIEDGKINENTDLFESIAQYFQNNARTLFSYIKTLAGAFAIFFIFIAGAHMISASGNEEKIEKEKKYLMHAITAFVTLLMLETLIFGFIYPENEKGITDPVCVEFMSYVGGEIENGKHSVDLWEQSYYDTEFLAKKYGVTEEEIDERIFDCKTAAELGASGSNQILGIVRFFQSLIGGIAIFFIVYSGISIISSMGNEEQVTKHKKMILWSLAGLAVILLAGNLVNHFFFAVNPATGTASVNVAQGLVDLAGVTNFIATFVGVFSVISIIIAGMIWVANFGNTEIAEKSKKVILGAVIGVALSISAYAIVNSITSGNQEGKGGGINIEISN